MVLFHCGFPGLSGGFIGVDVFFVLSGFLITGMLVKEIQETSNLNLLQFYARRVRRLLPAFALTLIVSLLVGAFILSPHELDLAGHAGRAAALYISNIFFDIQAGDYFARDVKSNPLLHTWSLAVEEQFYLFWPLLLLVTLRLWRTTKALATTLSVLTVVSLGVGVWYTGKGSTFAFYELPARAWEFGIGGLASLSTRGVFIIPRMWSFALGWVGILAVFGAAHFIAIVNDTNFPGWIALIPVLGTAAVLVAETESSSGGVGSVLRTAPLQVLGRLSYAWYLWHWPFLVFSEVLFPNITLPGKVVVAAASLMVAGLSYHLVENPVRYHPALLKRPILSVCFAGVITACLFGAAALSMQFATQLAEEPEMKAVSAAIHDGYRLPKQRCVTDIQSAEVKTCDFGNSSSAVTVVLFGDSHAMQWFNPLEKLAELNGWKLTTVVKSSCHSFDIRPLGHKAANLDSCAQWRETALKQIVAMRPTIVILGNLTTSLGQKDRANPWITHSLRDLTEGTRRTVQALEGLRVVIIRDIPYFQYDIPTCLARSIRHSWYPGGLCEADRSIVLNPAVFESERAGTQGLTNVRFIDITDRICQSDTCRPFQGDTVIYRDRHHVTGSYADSLMATLNEELLTIAKAPVDAASVVEDP
ncbi:MAG: acyltransferase [Nitrospira sp.]